MAKVATKASLRSAHNRCGDLPRCFSSHVTGKNLRVATCGKHDTCHRKVSTLVEMSVASYVDTTHVTGVWKREICGFLVVKTHLPRLTFNSLLLYLFSVQISRKNQVETCVCYAYLSSW